MVTTCFWLCYCKVYKTHAGLSINHHTITEVVLHIQGKFTVLASKGVTCMTLGKSRL